MKIFSNNLCEKSNFKNFDQIIRGNAMRPSGDKPIRSVVSATVECPPQHLACCAQQVPYCNAPLRQHHCPAMARVPRPWSVAGSRSCRASSEPGPLAAASTPARQRRALMPGTPLTICATKAMFLKHVTCCNACPHTL